jgi:glycosyltransferase involved in cell wall biosynthesis
MADFKVAQVVLSLARGGTERLVMELVRRTRKHYDSLVCCLDEPGEWAADLLQENVPVVSLGRKAGFRPSLGWRIASVVRDHGCAVLHCHQYSPFVYGSLASILTKTGMVFTEHGRLSDAPPSLKRRIVNPALGRLGARIFAVSTQLRDHMLAEGFPADRVSVIHNGIDPGSEPDCETRREARAVLGLPHGAIVIGTAARLDAVKDLGTLLMAFSHLNRTVLGTQLIVFGDGPERQALSAQCTALGVAGSVTFTGHRQDVRELLPALDVFANSSVSEGISLTILEAMAAGLPVVATAVGGTPEVVVHDQTGLLVPPRDPSRLEAALADLAANPARRKALGTCGRGRVLQYFTIDRMVADYVKQYERAAGKAS